MFQMTNTKKRKRGSDTLKVYMKLERPRKTCKINSGESLRLYTGILFLLESLVSLSKDVPAKGVLIGKSYLKQEDLQYWYFSPFSI